MIGCGDVTEVKSGPAFNKVANSTLIAVMSRTAEKAADYALRHGVPKWYTDAQQLINDPDINAVYVATPPLSHEEYAIAALRAGKPVYLEKPMTVSAKKAEQIVQVVNETSVKLTVAHYRRGQPMFQKLKELLEAGIIGPIRFVDLYYTRPLLSAADLKVPKIQWRVNAEIAGGGLFHDLAPHQLDLMIFFFGPVKTAHGTAANQGGAYMADDIVIGEMVFQNGVFFKGLWCFSMPPEEAKDSCVIVGSKGKITFSVFDNPVITIHTKGKEEVLYFDKLTHVQQPMIANVVSYFSGLSSNPCTAEEGLQVMRIIDKFTNKNL